MKKLILLILVGLLIVSCSPCKRLARKCPPQIIRERYDSIIVKDTIIYKDKIVEVKIPGKTDTIEKKIPVPADLTVPPIFLSNDYAEAKAWIQNSKLKLELKQKDQVLKFKLDSADKLVKHWEAAYHVEKERQTQVIRERWVPKFYKYALYLLIILIVIIGVRVYIKVKSGALTAIVNKFTGR